MDYLLPRSVETLPLPFIITCEGYGDACFLDALLKLHKIGRCSVGCPSRDMAKKEDSKNNLDGYLSGIKFARSRRESANLSGLLVVLDADDDPHGQFNMAVEALEANGFPKPTKPFSLETNEDFRTGVFLVPGEGRTGTIEHILLEATLKKNPKLGECLEQFANCTGVIPTGTQNQQAKMKMSSLVGACCKENPWASVALVWKDKGNPIPIESECFNPLIDFIRAFCA